MTTRGKAKKAEIGLIGGLFMDRIGRASRLIAPDTSTPGRVTARPGGVAGNVARILAALGHQVALAGAIGRDSPGAVLRTLYRDEGIETSSLIEVDAPTGCYLALHQPDGLLCAAIADAGAVEAFTPSLSERLQEPLLSADLWFLDANLPPETLAVLLTRAQRDGKWVAVDCVSAAKAPRLAEHLDKVHCLFGNLDEMQALFGTQKMTPEETMARALKAGVAEVVLTLGSQGFLVGSINIDVTSESAGPKGTILHQAALPGVVCQQDAPPGVIFQQEVLPGVIFRQEALPGRVTDVTGAGDAVIAAFLAARYLGKELNEAAIWAARAAAIALGQEGCAPAAFSRAQLAGTQQDEAAQSEERLPVPPIEI